MKRFFACLCAFALLLPAVSCGNTATVEPEKTEVNIDVPKDIEASISILVPGGNKNEETMIQCLIDDFTEEYPNVTIDMSYVTINSYESTVRGLVASGALDDIVWSNSPDFYYLVAKDYVENLNPYIAASESAGEFDVETDFYSEYFESGSLGGKLYCVPRSSDSVVTFINTDILTKAGCDMSKVVNGWSWDDFLTVCEKVRTYMDNNGQSSSYVVDANLNTWLSVCYPLLVSYGADVLDENGNIAIDSEATRNCLNMIREMVDKRYICPSTESSGSSFETGTSAMLFQSASVSLFADRKALKGKMDIVSFPLVQDNGTPKIGCGIAGYCINKQSKNKNLCYKFLTYMLSKEGQQRMGENGLNLASIRKDLSDYTTANWGKKYQDLNLSAYLYGSEYKIDTKFLSRADIGAKVDISLAITDLFTNVTNKSKTIDDCMNAVIRSLEDALDY